MEITYYLDDIIIYSSSWEQYHEGIPTLFQKLQEAKLTVNMKNSNLFRTYFRFLGHIVSFPINIKGDQRFPCMAGSYYQIVPNFSQLSEPLNELQREGCMSDFFSRPVWSPHSSGVITDASDVGLGA